MKIIHITNCLCACSLYCINHSVALSSSFRDGIFAYFINQVQNKLHIVLCMSPVGDAFRSRCRMFPSLVNCCTIDWFTEWPKEALLSVAETFFENIDLGEDSMKVRHTQSIIAVQYLHTVEPHRNALGPCTCPDYRGVLNSKVPLYRLVTIGTRKSVLIIEVSTVGGSTVSR